MAQEPQALQITLDPNGVAAVGQRVATLAANVVGTALRALASDDASSPEMMGGHWGYQFGDLGFAEAERRQAFENWVLGKGLQDLARGVRECLEEAVFYLSMIERPPGLTTMEALEADMAAIRAAAQKPSFPDLLAKVNPKLSAPLSFDAEFLSLQKTRNCLEHRGGRVGARDVDPTTGALLLTFPRLKTFYMRGVEEVELVPGEAIDTHSPDNPFGGEEHVSIYMRLVNRSRQYALGEPVVVSASDFFEIAMACHFFASDLATKLPTLPGVGTPDTEPTGSDVQV